MMTLKPPYTRVSKFLLARVAGATLSMLTFSAPHASAQIIPLPLGLNRLFAPNQPTPQMVESGLRILDDSVKGNNIQICVLPCRPLELPPRLPSGQMIPGPGLPPGAGLPPQMLPPGAGLPPQALPPGGMMQPPLTTPPFVPGNGFPR